MVLVRRVNCVAVLPQSCIRKAAAVTRLRTSLAAKRPGCS